MAAADKAWAASIIKVNADVAGFIDQARARAVSLVICSKRWWPVMKCDARWAVRLATACPAKHKSPTRMRSELPLQALRDTVLGRGVQCLLRRNSVSKAQLERAVAGKAQRGLGQVTQTTKRISMPFGAGPRSSSGRCLAAVWPC